MRNMSWTGISSGTIHAGGYEPLGGNAISLPQLRKFDEADRTRDKGDILLQITQSRP